MFRWTIAQRIKGALICLLFAALLAMIATFF